MFDFLADCIFEVLVAGSPLVICASTTMFSFGSPPRKARRATFASSLQLSLPSSTHVSMYVAIKHQAQELWTTVLPARPVNKTLLGDASKNRSKGTDRRRLLPTRQSKAANTTLHQHWTDETFFKWTSANTENSTHAHRHLRCHQTYYMPVADLTRGYLTRPLSALSVGLDLTRHSQ